jgi:hypothetical protein
MFKPERFWAVLFKPLVLPFFLLALVDCFMTILGTATVLGLTEWSWDRSAVGALSVAAIVAFGVLFTLLATFDIWGKSHRVLEDAPVIKLFLRTFWVVAFGYDLITTYLGIAPNTVTCEKLVEPFTYLVRAIGCSSLSLTAALLATMIICGSTIVASFMAYNERSEF